MSNTIPSAVESRTRSWFNLLKTGAPPCSVCGVQLNVVPDGGDHDGFHVTDVRQQGLKPTLGSAYQCRACAFDDAVQEARLRRVARVTHRGNYITAGAGRRRKP
jgi:hypothetical protein